MQAFCSRIDMLKENRCILSIQGAPDCQKVPKSYFQVNFLCQKLTEFFQKKKKIFKNINLGDHFL